jgi:hypothetical protein
MEASTRDLTLFISLYEPFSVSCRDGEEPGLLIAYNPPISIVEQNMYTCNVQCTADAAFPWPWTLPLDLGRKGWKQDRNQVDEVEARSGYVRQ